MIFGDEGADAFGHVAEDFRGENPPRVRGASITAVLIFAGFYFIYGTNLHDGVVRYGIRLERPDEMIRSDSQAIFVNCS